MVVMSHEIVHEKYIQVVLQYIVSILNIYIENENI